MGNLCDKDIRCFMLLFGLFLIGLGSAQDCPPCFNCMTERDKCLNGGLCNKATGICGDCPMGFGGNNCGTLLCQSLASTDRTPIDASATNCTCDPGWEGINCNICKDDSVCKSYRNDNSSICLRDHYIVKKHFRDCEAILPADIVGWLPPDKSPYVSLSCDVPPNKEKAYLEPATCLFQFWMDRREETFYCSLSGCKWLPNSGNLANYDCETATCHCIPGTTLCSSDGGLDFTELLSLVKGPGRFRCVDGSNCTFVESNLKDALNGPIALKCKAGECLLDTELPDHIAIPPEEPNVGMIAAIAVSSVAGLVFILAVFVYLVKRERALVNEEVDPSIDDESDRLRQSHIPAILSFENLSYHIDGMAILNGISGVVSPGHVMAIIGGSGAGKTSCLDILAGKSKKGDVTGKVLLNGLPLEPSAFRRIVGYVDQEDTLLGTLTVRETLMYSAMLRLPKNMSLQAKKVRVQQTMVELGIDHIADRKIGVPGRRGISGGEKRRVSIAQELVTSPSILFLDEPTSGLDAYNAFVVIDTIVKLAKNYNRTVVFTIHQPRTNIFAKFDQLLVLAAGEMIYSGSAADTSSHFNSVGFPIPSLYNPADFLIDLTLKPEEDILSEESLDITSSDEISLEHGSLNGISKLPESTPISSETGLADVKIEHGKVANTSGYDSPSKLLASREPSPIRDDVRLPGSVSVNSESERKSRYRGGQERGLLEETTNSPNHYNHHHHHHHHRPETFGNKVRRFFHLAPSSNSPSHAGNRSRVLHKRKSTHEMNEVERRIGRLVVAFKDSTVGKDLKSNLGHVRELSNLPEAANSIRALKKRTHRISFFTQFKILSGRTLLNLYRNPFLILSHYGISILIAVLVGFIFWQVQNDLAGAQNRMGSIFFTLVFFGFGSLTTLDLFAPERLLFTRERANGFYGSFPYFLSKVLFDVIPLRLVPPLLYGSIVYYMIGLYPDKYVMTKFLLILVLFNLSVSSMCLIIAITFRQAALGNLVASIAMLFSMLFSGFLLNKESNPGLIASLVNISPFNYAFEALAVNELMKITIKDPKLLNIPISGSRVIAMFGFEDERFGTDVIALSLMFLTFCTVSFLLLKFYVKEQR